MYKIRTPGLALRATRRKSRISQAELAKKAGTSQSYVVKIEQNAVDPRLSTLSRLFDILNYEIVAIPKSLMETVQGLIATPDEQGFFLNILPEEQK
ncbi:MAG: XRE family transcriptional regulator [Candidatus Meridianibacter frigidus]|nr:MAG: XRE family transcriptional regulator [Candidatus Eremiobacteraeota bacterium]